MPVDYHLHGEREREEEERGSVLAQGTLVYDNRISVHYNETLDINTET